MGERIEFISAILDKKKYDNVPFYMSINKHFRMVTKIQNDYFESEGSDYEECMAKLLSLMPEGSKIVTRSKIGINNFDQKITLEITISNRMSEGTNDNVLHFLLKTNYHDTELIEECEEDFSIALQKVINNIDAEVNICAYCKYADFKSDGSEELRHGWYCFREVENFDEKIPWYNRLNDFEQAIPFVDAFHWCPRFDFVNRKL